MHERRGVWGMRSRMSLRNEFDQYDAAGVTSTSEREAELKAQLSLIANEVVDRMLFVGEALLTDECGP